MIISFEFQKIELITFKCSVDEYFENSDGKNKELVRLL